MIYCGWSVRFKCNVIAACMLWLHAAQPAFWTRLIMACVGSVGAWAVLPWLRWRTTANQRVPLAAKIGRATNAQQHSAELAWGVVVWLPKAADEQRRKKYIPSIYFYLKNISTSNTPQAQLGIAILPPAKFQLPIISILHKLPPSFRTVKHAAL